MGRAGRKRMTRRFDWRVAAEETVKVYQQVIAQHGGWRLPSAEIRASAQSNVQPVGRKGTRAKGAGKSVPEAP